MTLCIIGNGIIGMMTAYALSKRAPDVAITLVGPERRTGCASLAAAAMFNSFCEVEEGTLASPIERQRFLFNKESNALWPQLLKDIASESGLPLHYGFGTFLIRNSATDSLEDRNFDDICAALKEFNEPHHEVPASEIHNYKPAAEKRLNKAIFIPNEGWVNPLHLIACLDAIISKRKNIRTVDAECDAIVHNGGKVSGVKAGGTDIPAERVLVCNGAEFTNLMTRSKLNERFQRVFYGVGSTLVLECDENATDHCIRTPNRGLACGLYSAPQTASEVVIGASNFISPTPLHEPRTGDIYTLLKNAMEQINTDYYKSRVLRTNVGWRPTSPDTLPLIGPSSIGGLLIATGTKRDGFHCSPTIASYLCDMITTGVSKADMSLYAPERPLTRLYSREAAIEKYVNHTINALYQHDFVPSKNRLVDDIRQHYRHEFSELHDKVGAKDWGIPIEMKDMYKYGHIS